MRIPAFILGMVLLAAPLQAQEVDCSLVKVDLPEDWKVISAPVTEDGLTTAAFGDIAKSASLSVALGEAEGRDAGEMAALLAPALGALTEATGSGNQYGFKVLSRGQQGYCQVSADDSHFLVLCIHGNMAEALPVMDRVRSDTHPALLPR